MVVHQRKSAWHRARRTVNSTHRQQQLRQQQQHEQHQQTQHLKRPNHASQPHMGPPGAGIGGRGARGGGAIGGGPDRRDACWRFCFCPFSVHPNSCVFPRFLSFLLAVFLFFPDFLFFFTSLRACFSSTFARTRPESQAPQRKHAILVDRIISL